MFWMWGFSLVLICAQTSNGNTTPLQCYACSKCDDCSNAPLTTCFNDQDVCAIVATWSGDPYSPLKIAKHCDSKSHCPSDGDAVDKNETHCDVTLDGVRCMMCCTGDGCNDGAVGNFPAPPPMPPIQMYKFKKCKGTTNCEVSAFMEADRINLKKYCDKPLTNGYTEPEDDNIDKCNIQDESDLCVTCCDENCFKTTSDSQRTTSNIPLIVILGCLFNLKICR